MPDYINYTLAKSEVPDMYIVGGVGFGKQAKKQLFAYRLKKYGLQKNKNNKCLKKHSLQLLFNTFYCEINNKKLFSFMLVTPKGENSG